MATRALQIVRRSRRTICRPSVWADVTICIAVCGVTPWFWLFLVVVLGIGAAAAVMSSCFGALFILRSPEEFRGRVSSAVNGLLQAASITSLVVVGSIGATVGARHTFVAAGAVAVVVVLLAAPRVLARARHDTDGVTCRPEPLQPSRGGA